MSMKYDVKQVRAALDAARVMYEVFNNGGHLRVHSNGASYDLWPSSGKWKGHAGAKVGPSGEDLKGLFTRLGIETEVAPLPKSRAPFKKKSRSGGYGPPPF